MRVPGFGVVKQISHIWHPRQDYGRTYGQPDTVSYGLQTAPDTPPRPGFYIFSLFNENGEVVASKASLVQRSCSLSSCFCLSTALQWICYQSIDRLCLRPTVLLQSRVLVPGTGC